MTSGSGPPRGIVDRSLVEVPADSDEDNDVADTSTDDSDNHDSQLTSPIAKTVRPNHDQVPAIERNVRQP